MNAFWVYVNVILGTTLALPVKNLDEEALLQLLKPDDLGRNNALENILINVLEDMRELMLTGNEDVPVLDPFYHDRLLIDDSILPIPGARLYIEEITVSKLSTFELNAVEISSASIIPQRYNALVDAEVPVLDVDVGKYGLSINVNGLSLFGAGDAKITLIQPRIRVDLLVGVRFRLGAIYLNLQRTRIEFSLADIRPAITGLFHDPSVDLFVNAFIRNLILELLDAYSELITDTISPIVQNLANEILQDLNLIDLLAIEWIWPPLE